MSRIEVKNGQVLIDGKPEIVISGEVHYYRLKRDPNADHARSNNHHDDLQ